MKFTFSLRSFFVFVVFAAMSITLHRLNSENLRLKQAVSALLPVPLLSAENQIEDQIRNLVDDGTNVSVGSIEFQASTNSYRAELTIAGYWPPVPLLLNRSGAGYYAEVESLRRALDGTGAVLNLEHKPKCISIR